jgi:acyl carrier protein
MEGGIDSDSIHQWDSITHLNLVTNIEEEFDVMFETEDILEFKSYEKGKEILKKYDIEI